MTERSGEPRKPRSSRKSAEKAAQSILALIMLSTASGCATYDMDGTRPVVAKSRPYAPRTSFHVVERGETLSSIARSLGVSRESIITLNRLYDPDSLRPGQRILVPRAAPRVKYANKRAGGFKKVEYVPSRTSRKGVVGGRDLGAPTDGIDPRLSGARYYGFEGPREKPGDDRDVEFAVEDSEQLDLDAPYDPERKNAKGSSVSKHAGNFIWPVRGNVISGFGGDATGHRNDGINIAADADAPVKAAEGGVVIYAGNELSSYGNLLLVRHPSGYVTAYAHNKKLLVKKNEKVKRGQKIALVGDTGDVDRPQLHFEIRRGNKPVDPKSYLTTATASR